MEICVAMITQEKSEHSIVLLLPELAGRWLHTRKHRMIISPFMSVDYLDDGY